jgi:hypothetical protein
MLDTIPFIRIYGIAFGGFFDIPVYTVCVLRCRFTFCFGDVRFALFSIKTVNTMCNSGIFKMVYVGLWYI